MGREQRKHSNIMIRRKHPKGTGTERVSTKTDRRDQAMDKLPPEDTGVYKLASGFSGPAFAEIGRLSAWYYMGHMGERGKLEGMRCIIRKAGSCRPKGN